MRLGARALALGLTALLFWFVLFWGAWKILTHPGSGLPAAWNPLEPIRISDPVNILTPLKLGRTLRDPALCLSALGTGEVAYREMPPLIEGERCGIANRVRLSRLGQTALRPVETSCAIALRMAMWETHGLRPAAQEILGAEIEAINHMSSYNCRPIRTMSGPSERMSTHATGEAIDIAGFRLVDGRQLRLISDWAGSGREAAFLKEARDSACTWFRTTLGPEYNALHADHFHLQSTGWGTCQ